MREEEGITVFKREATLTFELNTLTFETNTFSHYPSCSAIPEDHGDGVGGGEQMMLLLRCDSLESVPIFGKVSFPLCLLLVEPSF